MGSEQPQRLRRRRRRAAAYRRRSVERSTPVLDLFTRNEEEQLLDVKERERGNV